MNGAVREAEAPAPWRLYSAPRRWLFVAVLFLASTSNYADRQLVAVLLEPIKQEFGVSDAMLGLLSGTSFAVFYAVLGIPVARWADRGDRKALLTLALVVWSVFTVLCGLATGFWMLALLRVGVGAGEAGGLPTAQSLIADYFAPNKRGRALAVFMSSATLGYLVAFTGGSQIAAAHGWRAAFVAIGAPGLLFALLAWILLGEPRRRITATAAAGGETAWRSLRALAANPAYVNLIISMVFYFLFAYGAIIFYPAFMVRILHIDLRSLGAAYGLVSAAGALIGTLVGGVFIDALARRGGRWITRGPALALLLALALTEASFVQTAFPAFLSFSFAGGLLLALGAPSLFTLLHRVCGAERRATAVAVAFFFANLIGLGLGPVITGALSDGLRAAHGAEGLRYALLIAALALAPCALFLDRAGRFIRTNGD